MAKQASQQDTQSRSPVVHSIDVGFGWTKHTMPTPDGIGFSSFLSMAIPSDPSALREIATRRRDTVDVVVSNGASYEVGPDILSAQTGNDFGREISSDFMRSPIYEALMKGALLRIGEPVIDTLVIGLPVSQFLAVERHEELIARWKTGPDKKIELNSDHAVTILDVVVRPQPQGGYIEMFNHLDQINAMLVQGNYSLPPVKEVADLMALSILVVDPGEHTLDWLLMQAGQINTKASGAADDAGRHRVVRAVAQALEADVGRPLGTTFIPVINEKLRTGQPVKVAGKLYPLDKYKGAVASAVADPLGRLVEGLRGMIDTVDLAVVVGGHPEMYQEQLSARYPDLPILILEDSVMANVRGYQVIGEQLAQAQA